MKTHFKVVSKHTHTHTHKSKLLLLHTNKERIKEVKLLEGKKQFYSFNEYLTSEVSNKLIS